MGEISEKKGIKLLLELATKLNNNLTLTVVGNGPLANEVQNSCDSVTAESHESETVAIKTMTHCINIAIPCNNTACVFISFGWP